jgi:hypothetical protein
MTVPRVSRRQQGLLPVEINEVYQEVDNVKYRATYHTTDCKCIIYNSTGEIYRGQMKNDMRHGNGLMIYDNGVVYEGLWENNNPKHVKIYTQDSSLLDMMHVWLQYGV